MLSMRMKCSLSGCLAVVGLAFGLSTGCSTSTTPSGNSTGGGSGSGGSGSGGSGSGGTIPARDAGGGPTGPSTIGSACTTSTQCTTGSSPFCLGIGNDGSGGVCSSGCVSNADCGTNGVCGFQEAVATDGGYSNACLLGCSSSASCPSGFACDLQATTTADTTVSVCAVGCATDADCAGGTCNTASGLCGSGSTDPSQCPSGESLNACGGCGELAAAPGTSCGPCSLYQCSGTSLTCQTQCTSAGEVCDTSSIATGQCVPIACGKSGYVTCSNGSLCGPSSTCTSTGCTCDSGYYPVSCNGTDVWADGESGSTTANSFCGQVYCGMNAPILCAAANIYCPSNTTCPTAAGGSCSCDGSIKTCTGTSGVSSAWDWYCDP